MDKSEICTHLANTYPDRWLGKKDATPIVILSSGKCGTTTLNHLLNLSDRLAAYHELAPRLWHLGNDIFHDDCKNHKWDEIYWAARRDVISTCQECGFSFVENNHRASVFLPAIKRLFPKAKFIILWRDFDETVISSVKWGMYGRYDRTAKGRVWPDNIDDSRIACAWYWVNLYEYILAHTNDCDIFSVPFRWIKNHETENLQKIFDRLNVGIPEVPAIKRVLNKKYNKGINLVVPKVWDKYDYRAKQITHKLREFQA